MSAQFSIKLEPLIPKVGWTAKDFEAAIEKSLTQVGRLIKGDFEQTTRGWKTRVNFTTRLGVGGKHTETASYVQVSTKNKIYTYVARGTKPHIIRPRAKPLLHFRTGYIAKTIPGFIGTQSGGAKGAWVVARVVLHPGSRGRKFEEVIATRRKDDLRKLLSAEIARTILRK